MKTRQTVAKRFRITKSKKILHRKCGQDHFNAKEPGRITLRKHRNLEMSKSVKRIIFSSTGKK